jgi:hypothetical protein
VTWRIVASLRLGAMTWRLAASLRFDARIRQGPLAASQFVRCQLVAARPDAAGPSADDPKVYRIMAERRRR